MTQQNQMGNPFQFWTDLYSKWSETWAGMAASGPGAVPPQMGNPGFPLFNAPQSPDLMKLWNDMFQQYVSFWSGFWEKNANSTPSPDMFREAERQWAQQLESQAKQFAETMGTEAFAKGIAKFMEQSLYWQQKYFDAAIPQVDATLKTLNIPSRTQVDRLFERVIGLEDQLFEMEQRNTGVRDNAHLQQEILDRLEKIEESLQRSIESKTAS